MTNNIEIFYTGGGITLAEIELNDNTYAVVSSDALEFFSLYKNNDEKTYLPDDMLFSTLADDLTSEFKPLYNKMVEKLKSN